MKWTARLNMLMFGSGPLYSVTRYVIKIIEKMQHENIKYWVPKQTATDEFNDHAQTWMNGSVWEDNCNAWCTS
jgi:hypothetical protein